MPIECESRAAESGADVCAAPARWLAASRTNSEPRRFVRSARLHDAGARERDARFADDPEIDAEDARLNRQATVAALCETALRSLVFGRARLSRAATRYQRVDHSSPIP